MKNKKVKTQGEKVPDVDTPLDPAIKMPKKCNMSCQCCKTLSFFQGVPQSKSKRFSRLPMNKI